MPVFVVSTDVPDGWSGDGAPLTLVNDGVERGPWLQADIVQQGLNASVLDELVINLVPVLLGEGIRNRGSLVNRGEGV